MKRILSYFTCNESLLLDLGSRFQFSGDFYITLVAVIGSLCGLVHGFMITQSELILTNESFLDAIRDNDDDIIITPLIPIISNTTAAATAAATTAAVAATTAAAAATTAAAATGAAATAATAAMINNSSIITSAAKTIPYNVQDYFLLQYVNLFFVGEFVGALFSSISDHFGRKLTLIYVSILSIFMLIWCSFAKNNTNLLTARFFIGFCLGLLLATAPVYLREVSSRKIRGRCIGYLSLNMVVGGMSAAVLYYFTQNQSYGWRISLLLPMIILLCKATLLCFIPESPRWILAQKTPAECLVAMRKLRRRNDVTREFNEIYRALTYDAREGDDWTDVMYNPSIRLRLFLSCIMQLVQQLVGVQIITIFGYEVLKDVGIHSIVLGLTLALFSGILGSSLMLNKVDNLGRKYLLLTGCISITIAWIGAALSSGLEKGKVELYFSSFVLRFLFGSFLCLFSFSYSFSIGSISWIFPAEIFPYRARAKASSITTACHFLSAIFGTFLFQTWLRSIYHSNTTLYLFILALLTICFALFVWLAIPETRYLRSEDFEELFKSDANQVCCMCCPDPRAGILGWRWNTMSNNSTINTIDGGSHNALDTDSSRRHNTKTRSIDRNYHSSTQDIIIPGFHQSLGPGSNSLAGTPISGSGGLTMMLPAGAVSHDMDEELMDASTLHKYSAGMRERDFTYIHNEEEPLVVDALFKYTLSSPYEKS